MSTKTQVCPGVWPGVGSNRTEPSPNRGSVAKFDFWGKIQKSCVRNSMTYRLPNSRKSNFATEPGLGVIRVFHIFEALVAAHVAGDELITVVEAQAIGIGFERERLPGALRGDGVAVRLDGNTKLPGGADLGHGGNVKGLQRHRPQRRPLGLP